MNPLVLWAIVEDIYFGFNFSIFIFVFLASTDTVGLMETRYSVNFDLFSLVGTSFVLLLLLEFCGFAFFDCFDLGEYSGYSLGFSCDLIYEFIIGKCRT